MITTRQNSGCGGSRSNCSALIRDAGITAAEFRAILGLDAEGRKAVAGLIGRTARDGAPAPGRDQGAAPGAS